MSKIIAFVLALLRLIKVMKKSQDDAQHEQLTGGADSTPPLKKRLIVKSKPTPKPKDPMLRQPGETVAEWWERTEK